MKKKIINSIVIVGMALCVLGGTMLMVNAASKPTIIRLSTMAANIERNHGTVLELELTMRGNTPVYEAKVLSGNVSVAINFNALNGREISRGETERLDSDEQRLVNDYLFATPQGARQAPTTTQRPAQTRQSPQTPRTAQISPERAAQIAVANVGGGTARDIDLETRNGRLIYKVEVHHLYTEHEVDVCAMTGVILGRRIDD
ncbi:MAG: PepSY domain-containing protein [Oscillospiraceae bacterium]|nr:PepSY domain-containing protein [Oscillospiraceae bacterium]